MCFKSANKMMTQVEFTAQAHYIYPFWYWKDQKNFSQWGRPKQLFSICLNYLLQQQILFNLTCFRSFWIFTQIIFQERCTLGFPFFRTITICSICLLQLDFLTTLSAHPLSFSFFELLLPLLEQWVIKYGINIDKNAQRLELLYEKPGFSECAQCLLQHETIKYVLH